MHKKSSLQIICIFRRSNYSGNVSDALGKTKENTKQLLQSSPLDACDRTRTRQHIRN